MGTKTTTSKKAVHAAEYGNAVVFNDQVAVGTGDLGAAAVIQPVMIPAGTAVHKVRVKTDDLDGATALTAKIGFTPADGSAAPSGADTAVSADASWARTAGVGSFDVIPPYVVEKDSYLNIVVGTGAGTPQAGNVYGVVEGEARGVK